MGRPSSAVKGERDYLAIANRYVRDVLSGKIVACKWVRLACQRQRDDLKRKNWEWKFVAAKAVRICKFIEMVPHIQGPKKGQKFQLEPWQIFILTTVFGWVSSDGNRRFREVYIEVPRGNGKSALTSPVGLYLLALDGEGGAEVCSAATTRDQAKKVFVIAQEMARSMPEFRSKFGVEVTAHSINKGVSWFRALSSDAGTLDGLNIHGALIDEFHAHKTRDLYDVLKTACAKRAQPLIWEITTAGSDRSGVCYEQRSYLTKILQGVSPDERTFGIIYSIDDEDDWAQPPSWEKANPNWGVSVFEDAIQAEAHQALQIAAKQPAFQTKHLNCWVNADVAWMDMVRLNRCADPNLKPEDFIGHPCVIGVDLASKLDLLAVVKLFWEDQEEQSGEWKRHYWAFGDYWVPEARLEITQNSQYRGWALDGYLHKSRGETNDFRKVEEHIRQDCRKFDVLEVAFDPAQAHEIVSNLLDDGIQCVLVSQNWKELSEPMKEIEAAVYDQRFHFNGDPVLMWAFSNVVCHPDKNDNLFPNKERFENKIDPVTAALTGLNRVMANPEGGTSVYETRGVLSL